MQIKTTDGWKGVSLFERFSFTEKTPTRQIAILHKTVHPHISVTRDGGSETRFRINFRSLPILEVDLTDKVLIVTALPTNLDSLKAMSDIFFTLGDERELSL